MIYFMKNIIKKSDMKFRKSRIYGRLKKIEILRRIRQLCGRYLGNWMLYNFRLHGDTIHLETLKIIVEKFGITSIVETGTYLGYTTALFAENFPQLKVYTCEINKEYYLKAKKNLAGLKNVQIHLATSPEFIDCLVKSKLLGKRPLFYLDAHWLDDWPLDRELKIISKKIPSSVISIDDFKVEENEKFIFDKYGEKECSLKLVLPNLKKGNDYNLLFPDYDERVIFKKKLFHPKLIGYVLIFHNVKKEFESIKGIDHIKRYYRDRSGLIKKLR